MVINRAVLIPLLKGQAILPNQLPDSMKKSIKY